MSSIVTFTAIKSTGGRPLETDGNGYYKVVLGYLNMFNAHGDFWVADGVKQLVENQSHAMSRKLKSGYLIGERGHPAFKPGMSMHEFVARNMILEPTLECFHIRSIEFEETNENITPPTGNSAHSKPIKIIGWIKPSGPYGKYLAEDLENPDRNVAFSIRAITMDQKISGTIVKKIDQIITWDYVNEPGIIKANKFDAVSTESIKDTTLCSISLEDFSKIGEGAYGVSTESTDIRNIVKEVVKERQKESPVKVYDIW